MNGLRPLLTGAEFRYCGAAALENFINPALPGDCIFANSPGLLSARCANAQVR